MRLRLAIETSASRYGLALGEACSVLFECAEEGERRDLSTMLRTGLNALGAAPAVIADIAVDIGPGSLGSLRDGAAFANGLAYALKRPVFGFLSFELIGAVAHRATGLPVLCTRRANEGLAYAGLFDGRRVSVMRHGRLEDIVPPVAPEGRVAVAGSFRDLSCAGRTFHWSGVEAPEARTMIDGDLAERPASDAPVFPLTETSAVFRD